MNDDGSVYGPACGSGRRTVRQSCYWGSMKWLAEGESLGVSMARMIVSIGETSPVHRHSDCNEVVHLLQGEVRQRVGGKWIAMCAGATVVVPVGVVHQTSNIGDQDAILMICYSSGTRAYEEVTG